MQVSLLSKLHTLRSSVYRVPWCVPAWGWNELLAFANCVLTGHITKGTYPQCFADAVRTHLGLRYALPVNHGRVAIELALRAIGVSRDDDVVLPSYLCRSVLDAITSTEARPVFADVGPDLNVTPPTIASALTAKTKCVIVPHLFGKAAPIDEIEVMLRGTGIALIDDAAQSFGARCSGRLIGTFGQCGIIGCGPGKSLAGPVGGLLVTNDRELYERAAAIPLEQEKALLIVRRILSFWLWRRFRRWTLPIRLLLDKVVGMEEERPHVNCTLSNADAAIALEQFRAYKTNALRRRSNAGMLLAALGDISKYSISQLSPASVLVKLVLVLPNCEVDKAISVFASAGLECQSGYIPLHLNMGGTSTGLPVTETLWNRIVCLPVDSELKGTKRRMLLSENSLHHRPRNQDFLEQVAANIGDESYQTTKR